jgi:hypothetical protein
LDQNVVRFVFPGSRCLVTLASLVLLACVGVTGGSTVAGVTRALTEPVARDDMASDNLNDGFVFSTHDMFQGNRLHKGMREPETNDYLLPIGGGRLAYVLRLKSNKPTAVHPLGQGGGCAGNTGVIFGPHYIISKKSRNAPRSPAVGRNATRAKPST